MYANLRISISFGPQKWRTMFHGGLDMSITPKLLRCIWYTRMRTTFLRTDTLGDSNDPNGVCHIYWRLPLATLSLNRGMNLNESKWLRGHRLEGPAIEPWNGRACSCDLHQVGSNKWVFLPARDKIRSMYGTAVIFRLSVTMPRSRGVKFALGEGITLCWTDGDILLLFGMDIWTYSQAAVQFLITATQMF